MENFSNFNYNSLNNTFDNYNKETTKIDSINSHNKYYDSELSCINCNSDNTVLYEDGMMICNNCGELNDYIIDQSNEATNYENSETRDTNRCGLPVNPILNKLSYGTSIQRNNCSFKNNTSRYNLYRIHTYITEDYACKSLLNIFSQIDNKAASLDLPKSIVNDIKQLYKEVNDIKISRGNKKDALILSCIYFACKNNNFIITTNTLAKKFNVSSNDITTANKKIKNILHSKQKTLLNNINPPKPEDYLTSYVYKLNLSDDYNKLILLLIKKCEQITEITQNTPHAVICGILYLISNIFSLNITLEQITTISDISLNTIKNCYKKILNNIDLLFSDKLKNQLNLNSINLT